AAGDRHPARGRPRHRLSHPPPDRRAQLGGGARLVERVLIPLAVGCAVALLPTGGAEQPATSMRIAATLVGAGALLVALGAILSTPIPVPAGTVVTGVAAVGRVLLGPLIVPFELTAPLLLVAIIGAVTLWRRQEAER